MPESITSTAPLSRSTEAENMSEQAGAPECSPGFCRTRRHQSASGDPERSAFGDDLIPVRDDFLGTWSEDLGRFADLSSDTVLTFDHDGTLTISQQGEKFQMKWDCPSPGQLVLINESGHRFGPFQIVIEPRDLPLGKFDVLDSSGALLPFGRKRFSRIPRTAP